MFSSRKDSEEAQAQLQQLSQHIDFYHPKIAEVEKITAQFLAYEKECLAAIEGFLSEFKPLALAQSEASRKLHEAKALDIQIKNDEKNLWILNNLFNPTQEKF